MASWPISIDTITVGKRFRKDIGDIDALAESMRYHGCVLSPILIDGSYQVINGERRLRAAQRLGWSHIEAQVVDLADPLSAELDENEQRKPFTVSERVSIARALEERFPERRGQRTSPAAEDDGPEAADKIAQLRNSPVASPPSGTHKRDWIARRAGFDSGDSLRRAAQVVEAGIPALVEALDRGEVSIAAAADVATLPAAEQAPIVAAGPKAIQAKAGEVRKVRARTRPEPNGAPAVAGKTRVDGVLVDDPPEIAEQRRRGLIAPDVVPEVETGGEPTMAVAEATREPGEDEPRTDEEWLETLPARSKLSETCRVQFDRDALGHRETEAIRAEYARSLRPILSREKRRGKLPPFLYRLGGPLKLEHPRKWLACPPADRGGCGGTGELPAIGPCPKCAGFGYMIFGKETAR